jgi:hypothetical protein
MQHLYTFWQIDQLGKDIQIWFQRNKKNKSCPMVIYRGVLAQLLVLNLHNISISHFLV